MKVLHIDCSPRPESHSRRLSGAIVKKLLHVARGSSISRRDFGACPLPHAAPDYATALSSRATLSAPLRGALDLSEALIQEVEAVDVNVIGTHMHNLTVPSVLKAWIDQIPARRSHLQVDAGREGGNAPDRRVFVGIASGGVFTGEKANQPDFLTPYLSAVLDSTGLKTLQFLCRQPRFSIGRAKLAREKAIAAIDLTFMGEVPCQIGVVESEKNEPRRQLS
ncbi:FMN-dependent NADH-azoreductase, partial [Rhizobium sp. LjRoot258]|uniref:FMN-dependent NADH-azoreductase n=1 Tax=Rhizobium sp. LjRoot258 TaxID=3342299 RepID=UPI003F4FD32F